MADGNERKMLIPPGRARAKGVVRWLCLMHNETERQSMLLAHELKQIRERSKDGTA
jgi:hypothetical protein